MGRSQRIDAGTAILVDRVIVPLVKEQGIMMEGRAQFITLQSPDNGLLTIVNIYAPRFSNNRTPLWRRINQVGFALDHIILGGNFNHLKEIDRTSTFGERQMHRREAASWHHMTLHYGLVDAWRLDNFHKMSKKEYTYDNRRSGTASAVSQIDKFMISQAIDERGRRIETTTSMRKLSDHSPLIITIWGQHTVPNNPLRFFNTSLLNDEKSKKEMLEAWDENRLPPSNDQDWPAWLEAAIGRVMHCNTRLARAKKRAQGTRVRTHAKKIQLAEIQLQRDPSNEEVR
jgi:hypothetical protein